MTAPFLKDRYISTCVEKTSVLNKIVGISSNNACAESKRSAGYGTGPSRPTRVRARKDDLQRGAFGLEMWRKRVEGKGIRGYPDHLPRPTV